MQMHGGLLRALPWGMATILRNSNPTHKTAKPLIQTEVRCVTPYSTSEA